MTQKRVYYAVYNGKGKLQWVNALHPKSPLVTRFHRRITRKQYFMLKNMSKNKVTNIPQEAAA